MSMNNTITPNEEAVSLWDMSASDAPQTAPLDGDAVTDVAIIGGGFTGFATALHLAEKGVDCRVLEAEKIGFGGSGRNCGMVNPGIWLPPQDVRKQLGEEGATRFLDVMGDAPNYVFSLIEKFNMDCEATRNGTIHAAHSMSGFKELSARAEEWQRRGRKVELLDADQAAVKIGTSRFFGGLLDRQAGTINPMGYARGLAKAAIDAGAIVNSETKVTKLTQQGDKWLVQTEKGTITANRVVLGTNAYTDELWPGLKQTFTTIYYYQLSTEPLGELANTILPEEQSVWDTGLVMFSVRKDKAGRLIIGSMGKLGGCFSEYWAQKQIQKMFPHLGKVRFESAWHGKIAMTPDHLPRIHCLAPNLYTSLGFNGRGITTGTVFGKTMADLFTGSSEDELLLPISGMKTDWGSYVKEPVYEGCFKAWRTYKSI